MFEIIAIPAFKDNYIWLLRKGRFAVVVDPGEAKQVQAFLDGEGLHLAAILVTHKHADHQGGIPELLSGSAGRVAVYGSESESITGVTHPLRGGEVVNLPELEAEFQVIAVPGHTRGHLAFYGQGCLFCGDSLFTGGSGRLFEGTPAQMHASLQTLARLSPETWVYCAHEYTEANLRFALAVEPGNAVLRRRFDDVTRRRANAQRTVPERLEMELATNPFLRVSAPDVRAAALARDPLAIDDANVFAALRAWKNEF